MAGTASPLGGRRNRGLRVYQTRGQSERAFDCGGIRQRPAEVVRATSANRSMFCSFPREPVSNRPALRRPLQVFLLTLTAGNLRVPDSHAQQERACQATLAPLPQQEQSARM